MALRQFATVANPWLLNVIGFTLSLFGMRPFVLLQISPGSFLPDADDRGRDVGHDGAGSTRPAMSWPIPALLITLKWSKIWR